MRPLLPALLVFGLLAVAAPLRAEDVVFRDAFGLSFDRPVAMLEIPGARGQFVVVEQSGKVQRVYRSGGKWRKAEFAAFKAMGGTRGQDERGLLGLAFHPRFERNRLYYVNLYGPMENTLILERRANAAATKDSGEGRVLLEIEQPFGNHNGGTLAFGRDGYLYIGMGDGGGAGDPYGRAQDPGSLLGKMLRIDVNRRDEGKAYAVPRDNPFVRDPGYRPEIWALGLRNPWKWTFHPLTGELWAADVGQNKWEEVSIVPRGGNMGWPRLEGNECFAGPGCSRRGMVPPRVVLSRAEARSITGGEFYTADRFSPFHGAYVFGDYATGTVWALSPRKGREPVKIGKVPAVSSFARDGEGNVYALGLKDGVVRRVEFEGENMKPER